MAQNSYTAEPRTLEGETWDGGGRKLYIPSGYPGYFLFQLAQLLNVDGMKGLWCSNTVRLLSTLTEGSVVL